MREKGHETYQEIRGNKYPFDDVSVVQECFCDHVINRKCDHTSKIFLQNQDCNHDDFTDQELADGCCGTLEQHGVDGSISTDTRTITEGIWFVALVGDRFDAHDF